MAAEETVKITSLNTAFGTAGVLDNIRIVPGSKRLDFDRETHGGGTVAAARAAKIKVQSFTTHLVPSGAAQGMEYPDAVILMKALETATLAAGTVNGASDLDATGIVAVQISGQGMMQATITVG